MTCTDCRRTPALRSARPRIAWRRGLALLAAPAVRLHRYRELRGRSLARALQPRCGE